MAYVSIENFAAGVDQTRPIYAAPQGTLWQGINGHLSRGGDFEKRKAAGAVGKQSKSPERVNGASHANTAPLGDAVSRDVQRDGVSDVSGTTGDAPGDATTGVQRPDQPVNPWQVKSEYAKGELVRPHLDSMERWLMPPIAYRRHQTQSAAAPPRPG